MKTTITILGTGSVGSSLGRLLQHHGHDVTWAAREPAKAAASLGDNARVVPLSEAAATDVIIVAVPWSSSLAVLLSIPGLAGKIIVDATNPLNTDWSPLLLGQENSAGEETQRALPGCRVVKAFNTIFADVMSVERLAAAQAPVAGFLCGDDEAAKVVVAEIMHSIGLQPVDTGTMHCARYLETMAHLNINIAVSQKGGTQAFFAYEQHSA
jgi:8-hydroxy-5-deazaflavin:NADPH oxidoreductase